MDQKLKRVLIAGICTVSMISCMAGCGEDGDPAPSSSEMDSVGQEVQKETPGEAMDTTQPQMPETEQYITLPEDTFYPEEEDVIVSEPTVEHSGEQPAEPEASQGESGTDSTIIQSKPHEETVEDQPSEPSKPQPSEPTVEPTTNPTTMPEEETSATQGSEPESTTPVAPPEPTVSDTTDPKPTPDTTAPEPTEENPQDQESGTTATEPLPEETITETTQEPSGENQLDHGIVLPDDVWE